MNVLVTGGAGFIGSNFIRHILATEPEWRVINIDLLTYAGSLASLEDLSGHANYAFVKGDIADSHLVESLLNDNDVDMIVNFAAESHVDRSITGPAAFIQTNIIGTFTLLEAARQRWLAAGPRTSMGRFLHVSTDEVYGTLEPTDPAFSETTAYRPNSPYSASKAASDHLVRSYGKTYDLPVVTTNCSNNYGPFQHPEKLIPLMIVNALTGKNLPVYGNGEQVRDWLYVVDHCEAIRRVLKKGRPGETYNIGGWSEKRNIDVVHILCDTLDKLRPREDGNSYRDQISHVTDRPGHDRRYAVDATKIQNELGWTPADTFETGLAKTVAWYLENQAWVNEVMSENYSEWIALNYSQREGVVL